MKKEQLQIKTSLSLNDRIRMPQELLEGHFITNEQGYTEYTPYYADMVLIDVFFLHCVEGLSFAPEDIIYEKVTADEELMQLYEEFFDWNKDSIQDCPYKDTLLQMYGILADTEKMVEYKKKQLIHNQENALAALIHVMAKKVEELDMEKIGESLEALQ